MIEKDTIRLLRECDAGVKMGISSLDDVIPSAQSEQLKKTLSTCRDEHDKLEREIRGHLDRFGDEGKAPNPMARGMSAMKTNVELAMDRSDARVAALITDGCNMGVKSLSQYLNQYAAADEFSKDIAKRLIALEDTLAKDIRGWL